jgi:transcriptional regulator with XRE-family HTH domain
MSAITPVNILIDLDQRRRNLGLSCAALAQRAGISLRTVQRVLAGKETDPGLSTIMSLVDALGMSLSVSTTEDSNQMRYRQATHKAERLVSLVQGTSGLEAQGLPSEAIADLRERTVRDLLAGSSRKLWDE